MQKLIQMVGFAPLVLPDDSHSENHLVTFSLDTIEGAWAPIGNARRKAFAIMPIVCVLYNINSDKRTHLMSAVISIEKLTEERPVTFEILGKYGD
jgi:hypothetical protein